MKLEPGVVPDGWKRGEPLRVINGDFKYGPIAAVSRDFKFIFGPEDFSPTLEFSVRFHCSESNRIDAWLRWWNGEAK